MPSKPSPYAQCTRFLNGHAPRRPAEKLQEAINALRDGEGADFYGSGEGIEAFEADIASLLGKEAALFMPSGTMAQQIALRIWSDEADCKSVALHATSHLVLHEEDAAHRLHGIELQLLGDSERLFSQEDLDALGPVAAILWELPQREIGGQLPPWEELVAQCEWARAKGIRRHLDGARLWEAQPHYERSHAAICALFDSVYVSFYKGLGGIAGAALAGSSELIKEARPWLRRHGGNLISMYPFILSARAGLETQLSHFADYRKRARSLARALAAIDGITVVPAEPPTSMMHLHIDCEAKALTEANEKLAAQTGTMLFGKASARAAGQCKVELSIGSASASLSDDEVANLFARLISSSKTA